MNKTSVNATRHPYFRPLFYSNPENQFWNREGISTKTKDRLNSLVKIWEDENRNISTFE